MANQLETRRRVFRVSFPRSSETDTMPSKDLLDLLVCPLGHAALRQEGETLICTRCGPRFAIEDDIPNMIIEEATLPPACASLHDLECVKAGDARDELGDGAGSS